VIVYIYIYVIVYCSELICWDACDHIGISCMGSWGGNLGVNVNLGLFGLIRK